MRETKRIMNKLEYYEKTKEKNKQKGDSLHCLAGVMKYWMLGEVDPDKAIDRYLMPVKNSVPPSSVKAPPEKATHSPVPVVGSPVPTHR